MSSAPDRLNRRQGYSRAKPKLWLGGWGEEGRNQLPLLVGHRHVVTWAAPSSKDLVNIEMFLTAKEVEESLERRETATCLAWCHDNKSRLRKMKVCGLSQLDFWWGWVSWRRGQRWVAVPPLQDHHALTCLQPFGLVMVCKIELLDVRWGSRCLGVGALPLGKNPASCVGLVHAHCTYELRQLWVPHLVR